MSVSHSPSPRMTHRVVIAGHEKKGFEVSARRVKDAECASAVFIVALTNTVTAHVGALSGRQHCSTAVSS